MGFRHNGRIRVVAIAQHRVARVSITQFSYQRFRSAALMTECFALEQIRQFGVSLKKKNVIEKLTVTFCLPEYKE